jgi:hypothetical protein
LRDTIFISHANPEDNEFSRWLALQLIKMGYPVWCDLIKLKGGEDFWRDIEKSIRERTVKFIYVLSQSSNVKEGPLQELAVAKKIARIEKLKDFVIPVRVDSLPFSDINIELHRLNTISFESGWARGLKVLQEKLAEDSVTTSPDFTASTVASWWREQFSAERGVVTQEEELLSSWFPIDSLPKELYFHLLFGSEAAKREELPETDIPYYPHHRSIVTFASRKDFEGVRIGDEVVADTQRYLTEDLLNGKHSNYIMDGTQAYNAIIYILDLAWRRAMRKRGLLLHEMANSACSFYFVKDQLEKDKINFIGIEGKPAHRKIMGFRRMKTRDGVDRMRHWHYAISAKPQLYPVLSYSVRGHVLFSDDGKTIWESDKRLHKARMSQCRSWWNDDWRDRMLATMDWLSNGDHTVSVELANDVDVKVSRSPTVVKSPVTYIVPGGAENLVPVEDTEDSEYLGDDFKDEEEDE